MMLKRRIYFLFLFIALVSCGGGSDNNNVNNAGELIPDQTILPPAPNGILLSGANTDDARAATASLAPSAVPANEIDGVLLKTRLAAVIAPATTVGEVNTALVNNNAAIVSMMANDPYVTLIIDPVADRTEAQVKADALVASGAFIYARPGFTHVHESTTNIAPTMSSLSLTAAAVFRPAMLPEADAINWVAHLTPGRVPAAWNVHSQATASVNLLVPDWYKEGSTYIEIPQLEFSPYGGAAIPLDNTIAYPASNRGFHHLGVAAANMDFDSGISPHTGADPVAEQLLNVMAMHTYGLDIADVLHALIMSIQAQQLSHIVPNTVVLSTDTFDDPAGTTFSYLDRAWLALKWRRLVQETRIPGFVHIVAAGETGNLVADPALNTASLNSVFGIASGPDLVGVAGLDAFDQLAAFQSAYDAEVALTPEIALPLDNVLLVGSSQANGNVSSFSTPGAHVRTAGESVTGPCLLISPYCGTVSEQRHETGAAAAQVAGLASYLWHLDSGLSYKSLLLRLQHAYSASGTSGIVDAWIAVLSIDGDINTAAALRKTLLDVSGPAGTPDGVFTEHDIDALLTAFDAFAGAIAPDWSVYDLNGDGWTGGADGARMDLDINTLPGFSLVTQTVAGIEKQFDESSLTDMEVLCYYAWSPLYTGTGGVRENIPGCTQPVATPPQVEHAYSYLSLTASAGGRVGEYSPSTPAYFQRRDNSPGDSLSGGAAFADLNPPGVPEVSVSASANGDLTWSEVFDPDSLSLSSFYLQFSGSASASISDGTGFYSGSFASGATASDMLLGFTVIDAPSTVTLTGGYTGNALCSVYLGKGYTLDGENLFDYEELFVSDESGFVNETMVLAPGNYVTGVSCSVGANTFLDIDQSVAGDSGSGGMELLISFE